MSRIGRGGAGNVRDTPSPRLQPADLSTPTIKTSTYTTGRGGSGNMATFDPLNPAEARLAQDLDAPAAHSRSMSGTYHWGRGGEGNMTTIGGGSNGGGGKTEQQQQQAPRAQSKPRTRNDEYPSAAPGAASAEGSFISPIPAAGPSNSNSAPTADQQPTTKSTKPFATQPQAPSSLTNALSSADATSRPGSAVGGRKGSFHAIVNRGKEMLGIKGGVPGGNPDRSASVASQGRGSGGGSESAMED